MQLIYEGKDITNYVEICIADIKDTAGGQADSLEIQFDDPKKLWSQWKPAKNDTVQIIQDGFDTGVMYVDELLQQRGFFIIKALSIPQEAKQDNSKGWENVRFLEFSKEIASKYGLDMETYGIENNLYLRVDQFEKTDFEFLSWRCIMEGYALKVSAGKLIIYDERYMESLDAIRDISINDFDGDYKFLSTSTPIYGACRVSYGEIQSTYKPALGPKGPTLKYSDIYVSSQGEADRLSKNLLRYFNKNENTGVCTIRLDTGLAAGININIKNIGLADGKYFCTGITHRLVQKKTFLKLRRPLEGY